jgi:hypothetical protein
LETTGEGARGAGLGVGGGDPVVADLHGGQRDDLSEVRRIGQDFLIARHGRVEDALTGDGGVGAEGATTEYRPVFQGEDCRLGRGH